MFSYVSKGYICWRVARILLNLSMFDLLSTNRFSGIILSFSGNTNLGAFWGLASFPAMFVYLAKLLLGLFKQNFP